MAKPTKKYTKTQFQKGLAKYNFVKLDIMEEMGLSKEQFYKYMKDFQLKPYFEHNKELNRQENYELAEKSLRQRLIENYWPAVRYVLSTTGRDHYSEKQIIEQTEIEVIKPKVSK